VSTPDVMEGYEDPLYDEALLANIPEEFRDFTLEKLVHNRIELEHFRNFLAENYASMDIMCWMDIEAFKVHGLAIVNIQWKTFQSLLVTSNLTKSVFPDSHASELENQYI